MAAKSKGNMFGAAVQQREQEQQQIEVAVTKDPANTGLTPGGKIKKRGSNATTVTLSISLEDKITLKELAARSCMSASDLLHKWIVMESEVANGGE